MTSIPNHALSDERGSALEINETGDQPALNVLRHRLKDKQLLLRQIAVQIVKSAEVR